MATDLCPIYIRVVNDCDAVPCAWDDLSGLPGLYSQWNISMATGIPEIVDGIQETLTDSGYNYAQFSKVRTLPGVRMSGGVATEHSVSGDPRTAAKGTAGDEPMPIDGSTWDGQAQLQHASTTYMMLLGGQSIIS